VANNDKWYFKSKDDGTFRRLTDTITTNIFVGENIMFSLAEIDPHTEPTIHSHDEEQWGILMEGECVRIQDGEEVAMQKGDFWRTPGNTPHGVRTGDGRAVILDVFSPPRKGFLEPGEGLAAKRH
jgi:quercetin dioxygenase-like cupin family protein